MAQHERPVPDEASSSPSAEGAGDPDPGSAGRGGAKKSQSAGSFLRELPVLLLIAFVLAFLLRTFVVQVFYIPSSSMEPTLDINDRMVVEKVSYRFTEPDRGDIAVFEGDNGPGQQRQNGVQRVVRGVGQFIGLVPANARDYVKRVVGLPGDEIRIEDGTVFVNGEELDEPYVEHEDASNFGPVTVPEGHLFFLGDNRPNSSDSRRSLGFVPSDQLVGRASVIIWPLDNAGMLTGTEHEVPEPGDAPPADAQGDEGSGADDTSASDDGDPGPTGEDADSDASGDDEGGADDASSAPGGDLEPAF